MAPFVLNGDCSFFLFLSPHQVVFPDGQSGRRRRWTPQSSWLLTWHTARRCL